MQTTKCLSRIYLNFYQYNIQDFKNVESAVFSIIYKFWLWVMLFFSWQLCYSSNIVERYLPWNWGQVFTHFKKKFLINSSRGFFCILRGKIWRKCIHIIVSLPDQVWNGFLEKMVEKTLFKWFPFPPYPAGITAIERGKTKGNGCINIVFFPLCTPSTMC